MKKSDEILLIIGVACISFTTVAFLTYKPAPEPLRAAALSTISAADKQRQEAEAWNAKAERLRKERAVPRSAGSGELSVAQERAIGMTTEEASREAAIVGMTIKEYAGLLYAAQKSGVSTSAFNQSMEHFGAALRDAQRSR